MGAVVITAFLAGCQPSTLGQATASPVVRRAQAEGRVVVYANTDMGGPVVAGFQRRYPQVRVTYRELTSSQIQSAVLAEAASSAPVADLVWSSSMDIQVKLINDGYAQTYKSPEARRLPRWAVWRNQGFGVTAEPVGFAYNSRLLPPDQVPRSHAELLASLRDDPERWQGRIALYDPEQSGVGFMYLSADLQKYPEAWTLMEAIAHSRPGLYVPGGTILSKVAKGEHLIAFNMNRSYADSWAARNDRGVVYQTPTDYHFTVSRVAFVTRAAPHPNAARLFLDYLMSPEGQAKLRESRLTPVIDAADGASPDGATPIRVGPALLANLDQARRDRVLREWRAMLAGEAADGASPPR
ncbi:ABC transporter substrate-binding protein [Caulobacter mirabilis]|nr:ABC transporter substrate-binding protein [Caulobacter mirabilis]